MITVYSDGGSRGNPGDSAYAIVVCEDGKMIFEKAEFIGTSTNNIAEYRGLIAAVAKAIDLGADEAEFVMDSELVIKQMKGQYKVRASSILGLYHDAVSLSSAIGSVRFTHVRRSHPMISRADALLNEELDRHQGTYRHR